MEANPPLKFSRTANYSVERELVYTSKTSHSFGSGPWWMHRLETASSLGSTTCQHPQSCMQDVTKEQLRTHSESAALAQGLKCVTGWLTVATR